MSTVLSWACLTSTIIAAGTVVYSVLAHETEIKFWRLLIAVCFLASAGWFRMAEVNSRLMEYQAELNRVIEANQEFIEIVQKQRAIITKLLPAESPDISGSP